VISSITLRQQSKIEYGTPGQLCREDTMGFYLVHISSSFISNLISEHKAKNIFQMWQTSRNIFSLQNKWDK